MVNDIFRVQTLTKLNTSLTVLANQIQPDSQSGLSLFSGVLMVLDKNLVLVQEHTVDIRNNLQEVEDIKYPQKKIGLWNRFITFLKELFN